MFMRCFLEIKFADIRLILLEHVTYGQYVDRWPLMEEEEDYKISTLFIMY